MNIDLTVTISVILTLTAIASPIATSIINNIHDSKIKKLELRNKHLQTTIHHRNEIFENYLRYAGRCIAVADINASKEYYEYYFLSLLYVSDELRAEMKVIHQYIENGEYEKTVASLQQITPKLYGLLQEL